MSETHDSDGAVRTPKPDWKAAESRIQKRFSSQGREFLSLEDQRALRAERKKERAPTPPHGWWPGASGPNEPGPDAAPEEYEAPYKDFAIVKKVRQLALRSTVEGLRGIQRLKDVSPGTRRGGGRPGEAAPEREDSKSLGDVLFALGEAHLRTWEDILKVTRDYGDSWLAPPRSIRPGPTGESLPVVELKVEKEGEPARLAGVFDLVNESPFGAAVRWPEVLMLHHEDSGTRLAGALQFEPAVSQMKPYASLESVQVRVDAIADPFDLPGRWTGRSMVTLAGLVSLDLRFRFEGSDAGE